MAEERFWVLERTARTLGRRHAREKTPSSRFRPLPCLWLLTDPLRTPDPVRTAERLPPGTGIIFRTFGAADAVQVALRLRSVARRKKLVLLIARDWRLAAQVGTDGVHLPENWTRFAPRLKRRNPHWIITAAAHGSRAVAAANRWDVDALLLSTVFESRSPTAGKPLGVARFERLVHASKAPVIGLGGINDITALRLRSSRAAGLAAVEGLSG